VIGNPRNFRSASIPRKVRDLWPQKAEFGSLRDLFPREIGEFALLSPRPENPFPFFAAVWESDKKELSRLKEKNITSRTHLDA
jgi:hypothetical protein